MSHNHNDNYQYHDGCPICFRNHCADEFLTNLDWFVQMITDELNDFRLKRDAREVYGR